MRHRPVALALVVLVACAPAGGPPGGLAPGGPGALVARDPIGFLLENRDSLRITDGVRDSLVRLNLRLYVRLRPIDAALDTLLFDGRDPLGGSRAGSQPSVPAAQRPLVDSLRARRAVLVAAARDTAWALLTPVQRATADSLAARPQHRPIGRGPR